jgi:hypothetical protein
VEFSLNNKRGCGGKIRHRSWWRKLEEFGRVWPVWVFREKKEKKGNINNKQAITSISSW